MPIEQLRNLQLDADLEREMADWLYDQITESKRARDILEMEWRDIQEFYELTELETKKDFPFEGAAHLMIQIMPMFCETMKAKIINTIFAPKDPFTPTIHRKELQDFFRPLRAFMTWASENELNIQEVMDTLILEKLKIGTCVAKVVYTKTTETIYEWDEAQNDYVEKVIVTKDSPEVLHFPTADFLWPLETRHIDDARWLSLHFRETWNGLEQGEKTGKYKDVERIKAWVTTKVDENERVRLEPGVDEIVIPLLEEYDMEEVWFSHPIKVDGPSVKLTAYFHRESRTFIKLTHNWFPRGMHPFELDVHEKREHRVAGFGVGHATLPGQLEISTMHNQRLDNGTISNAPLFKRKADSMIPEDMRWRAGGTVPVDEMDDIESLFTGQRGDSTVNDEIHTLDLLRERIGLQEFSGGMGDAQPTTVLAMLDERAGRFNQTIRTTRQFMGRVMTKVMLLYQKYYPEGRTIMVQGAEGQLTEIAINFPDDWIAMGMGVEVTATTSVGSKELQRQNKVQLFGLLTQAYGQITQYLLQAANPQLPPFVSQAMLRIVDGLTSYLEDVLADHDLSNSRELAFVLEGLRGDGQESGAGGAAGQEPQAPPGVAPGASPFGGLGG